MIDIGSIGTATAQVVAPPAKPEATDPKLLKAARDFESIFVRQMLKSVEKTTAAGGGTHAAAGQQTYGSMVVDTLSDSISKAGGLGLADVIARSMIAAHPSLKGTEASKAPLASPTANWAPTLKPLK
jgi:peptidoglycan hydrolase FlgJ